MSKAKDLIEDLKVDEGKDNLPGPKKLTSDEWHKVRTLIMWITSGAKQEPIKKLAAELDKEIL